MNIDKIYESLLFDGFFSEYLPENFNLEGLENILPTVTITKIDYIEPYHYTMAKNSDSNKRRRISLPEIVQFIDAVKYIKENSCLLELLEFSQQDKHSFSNIVTSDGDLSKHEQLYSFLSRGIDESRNIDSSYINNIISKIKCSQGAKGILHIDISDFYGSIYTHLIPSIYLGYETSIIQYKKQLKHIDPSSDYIRYSNLDKKIRLLNGNRTNGILTGPLISKVIAESLLCRIDSEIDMETSNTDFKFTRYVDDYEIYIYDEDKIDKITNIFSNIFNKYYLTINSEKIKYEPFPYYKLENLNKIIMNKIDKNECILKECTYFKTQCIFQDCTSMQNKYTISNTNTIELFNTFFELESKRTKGAIRYLVKSLAPNPFEYNTLNVNFDDSDLYHSYLLDILVNNSASLIEVCKLLISEKENISEYEKNNIAERLISILEANIEAKKDLEVIWLIFLIKALNIELKENLIEKILISTNELAIIIIITEFTSEKVCEIVSRQYVNYTSWILLYQLYLNNMISEENFIDRLKINNTKDFYKQLKTNTFTFYKKIY